MLPGTTALGRLLVATFPGVVRSTGGYDCRPNTADTEKLSIHGTGRALDAMISRINGQPDRRGDAVAEWLVEHAPELGVQYLIWDRTSWNAARPGAFAVYGGPIPHTDHVHLERVEGDPPLPGYVAPPGAEALTSPGTHWWAWGGLALGLGGLWLGFQRRGRR